MITFQLWQVIAGLLMTFVVGAVVRSDWKTWIKVVVAMVSSVIVGTVGAWIAGDLTGLSSWAQVVTKVYVAAQAAFVLFWKPTKIGDMWESWTDQFHPMQPELPPPVEPPGGGSAGAGARP